MKKALLVLVVLALLSPVTNVLAENESPLFPTTGCSTAQATLPPATAAEPFIVQLDDLDRFLLSLDSTGRSHPCIDCGGCCANTCGGTVAPWWCWVCC